MRDCRRQVLAGAVGALAALTLFGAGTLVPRSDGLEAPDATVRPSIQGQGLQFRGITTGASPDLGFFGLTRRCHAEFGLDTRMCSTAEIMGTVDVPGDGLFQSAQGWVQPVAVGVTWNTGSGTLVVADVSSLINQGGDDLNCRGWSITTPGQYGMVVTGVSGETLGQLKPQSCGTGAGVACCG